MTRLQFYEVTKTLTIHHYVSKSVSGSLSSGVSGTGSAEELAGTATGMGVALEGTTPSGALHGVRRSGYKRKVKHK